MLRIDIEEEAIVDGERLGRGGARGDEAQDGVRAVAVVVDQLCVTRFSHGAPAAPKRSRDSA